MKHIKIILFLFLGFIFSSCATLVNGTSQTITISSNPPGATVYVDSLAVGTTPLITNLSKKNEHKVVIELSGYEKQLVTINSSLNPLSLLWLIPESSLAGLGYLMMSSPIDGSLTKDPALLVVGGALTVGPIFTEFYFGALKKLSPENIYVKLNKRETSSDN